MEKATISDLKNQLSAYLAKVRAGASVLILDRDQPVARIYAQLGQETLAQRTARQADLARHLGQRGRGVGIGGVEQRAGLGHRPAEAEVRLPVAWLAPLARTEARRLRRLGRGVEVDVAAQRRTGRARRQAIDPGCLHREPEPAVVDAVAPLDGVPAGFRIGKDGSGEGHGG